MARAVVRRLKGRFGAFSACRLLDEDVALCPFCATAHRIVTAWHPEGVNCVRCDAIGRERFLYAALLDELSRRQARPLPFLAGDPSLKELALLEFSPRRNAARRAAYDASFGRYAASDFDQSFHGAELALDLTDDAAVAAHAASFDVVIFAHVLEHIPDYRHALRNLRRLLRPGGLAFVQVPVVEARTIPVTWDEFHGDRTRVFHRFGFDLARDLAAAFPRVTVVLGERLPVARHPEVKAEKYDWLATEKGVDVRVLGERVTRFYGCGPLELCDVFVAG